MTPYLVSSLIGLVPWLLGTAVTIVIGILGWRVGLPLMRIAELHARVDLLQTQLRTSQEQLQQAQLQEKACIARLDAATADLKEANVKIAALMTVFTLKTGTSDVAAAMKVIAG